MKDEDRIVYFDVVLKGYSQAVFDCESYAPAEGHRKEEPLSDLEVENSEFFAVDNTEDGFFDILWLQGEHIRSEERIDVSADEAESFDWLIEKIRMLSKLPYYKKHNSRFCIVRDRNSLIQIANKRHIAKWYAAN